MYSLLDVMEMLDISERTARRHLKLGILKGKKESGKWNFSLEDVEKYLSHTVVVGVLKQKHVKDFYEYSKGVSDLKDLIMISKNIPKMSMSKTKEFSKRLGSIQGPMRFNMVSNSDSMNVLFYGTTKGVEEFLDIIKER